MTLTMNKLFNSRTTLATLALLIAFSASLSAAAQEKRPVSDSVLGTVTAIDAASHAVTIKTDPGATVIIMIDDKTAFLRVPAGQTSLANAATIQFSDIVTGDKILARGTLNAEKTQLASNRLIVISKSDLETLHKQELDDWRKRGIYGVVKAVNPAANTADVEVRVAGVPTLMMVNAEKAG